MFKKLNLKVTSLLITSLALIVALVTLITPAYANELNLSTLPSDYGISMTGNQGGQVAVDDLFSMKVVGSAIYLQSKTESQNDAEKLDIDAVLNNPTWSLNIKIDNPNGYLIELPTAYNAWPVTKYTTNEKVLNVTLSPKGAPTGSGTLRDMQVRADNTLIYQATIRHGAPVPNGTRQFFLGIHIFTEPAISNSDVVLNDIDKPYTLEQIKQIANLQAHDQYYGDLTNDIELIADTYSENKNKVGNFTLTFKVTNPAGLSSETTLNVVNKDVKAPVLTGPATSSISYKTILTNADVIAKYRVSDNYDKDLEIKIENTNYVAGQVGTFTFNLSAKDSSGNTARATHTVTVFDDVKPTIVDKHIDPIVLNWKQKYTDADLLIDLTANDEIDGNITSKITIKSSDFMSGKVGNYTVVYEVSDIAGNKTEATRVYVIETLDTPVFYVSKNMLLIEDVNKMTVEQIINEIAKYEKFDVASYSIMMDEYTGNELTTGAYEVAASLSLNTGETVQIRRAVRVFTLETGEQPEPQPEVELPWYKVVWNHIVNFFITIANIFNYIINFFDKSWKILPYR